MKYDPDIHHRRSIRLQGYDYARNGAYFVTVCAQGRECLFGEIVDGEMYLNDAGRMVAKWWMELPERFPDVVLDEYVVMPNHFHGILVFVGAALRGRPDAETEGHPHRGAPTLGDVVDWFKTMTTNAYIRGVKMSDWPPFAGRLWQRNYYERVIRDEKELDAVREYIANNPKRWESDSENPANAT